jgi:hypothetical protein
MKHTATLILFILVIACAAAGFMTGKIYGYNDRPSLPAHVHRGGFGTEAEEGHYLIFDMTGEMYEMSGGEWKMLEICK